MLDIPGPGGEGVIPLIAYTGRLGGGGGGGTAICGLYRYVPL